MEKGKKTGLIIGLIVFGVLALGSLVSGVVGSMLDDSKTTETVTAKPKEKKTEPPKQEAPVQKVNQEEVTKKKVEEEKKKIKAKLLEYEDAHLSTWTTMSENMQKSDIYSSYEYADKALVQVTNIWQDSSKLNWGNTGDAEFDKQCKELKEEVNMAYFLKRESLKKLLVWFDDTQSPKKMNDAKKSLEDAGTYWQAFQMRAFVVTATEDDMKKLTDEVNKQKK